MKLSEKIKLQKAQHTVGKRYKILQIAGHPGAASVAFVATDTTTGKNCVIKIPHTPQIFRQKKQLQQNVDKLTANYNGNLQLPSTTFCENYIVENYLGVDFSFCSDTANHKQIGTEIGKFLAYLHNQNTDNSCETSTKQTSLLLTNNIYLFMLSLDRQELQTFVAQAVESHKIKLSSFPCKSVDEFCDMFEGVKQKIPREILNEIFSLLAQAEQFDTKDEVVTWTHGDVRSQNVLIDSNNVALIDFDLLSQTNIYSDFLPHCVGSQRLGAVVMKNLILAHNQNCKHKIDENKFLIGYKLGVVDESFRCGLARNYSTNQINNVLAMKLNEVRSFEENYKSIGQATSNNASSKTE